MLAQACSRGRPAFDPPTGLCTAHHVLVIARMGAPADRGRLLHTDVGALSARRRRDEPPHRERPELPLSRHHDNQYHPRRKFLFFFLMIPLPPRSTHFPYTTLFR